MQKRHLADALRNAMPEKPIGLTASVPVIVCAYAAWERSVNAIALACWQSNPKFDRERWINYIHGECGPNGGKR